MAVGMTAGVGVGCGHCIEILYVKTLGGVLYVFGWRRGNHSYVKISRLNE